MSTTEEQFSTPSPPRHPDGSPHGATNACARNGCKAEGSYRAPKNRDKLGSNKPEDYHFFCLDHIREHNQRWDYFDGMGAEEIEQFRRDALLGHRPTWKMGLGLQQRFSPERLDEALADFMQQAHPGFRRAKPTPEPPIPHLSEEARAAFATLDLPITSEWLEIKARYKKLAKALHPDVNKDNKAAESRFREVITAYRCLEAIFNG